MTGDYRARAVRVLIADNDARVRAALRSFLSASTGFDVVADAGSAAEALEDNEPLDVGALCADPTPPVGHELAA